MSIHVSAEPSPQTALPEVDALRAPPIGEVRRGNGWAVLVVQGELDLHNASALQRALEQELQRRPAFLVVDLAEVSFLDSTALHVLLRASEAMTDRRGLVILRPTHSVRRIFEATGTAGILGLQAA